MDRILSWKIDSSTFAYIYPIKNSYISNRIPEDSPLWGEIINEISVWTKDTYRANFDRMASEVKSKYGHTIPWQDAYWDFSDDNSTLPVNIVLLSGKDGNGSSSGSGQGDEIGAEIYEELRDAINKELDKAKKDIEEQNKRVEEFVEQKVGETIAEAKKTIAETEQKLAETREELETKLSGATEALDKAAALFDLGEGNITGEQIQDALTSIDECGEWLTSLSGVVTEFKTDYDAAKRIMGGIGSAEDALAGLFSQFGTTLNDVDDTVGTVESWMVASAATIGDIATWYDVNASAVTEASSIINASAGTITDAINFISGDGLTTRVTSIMDGRNATIKDEIMTETSAAVTNVRNEMNGLSGVVETSITRLNNVDGSITSLGSRMSAAEKSLEEWITVADDAMSAATDLRETWTIESGKLSTVANLTAETDADGNIKYYVSGETMDEKRVYLGDDGKWRDVNGTEYPKEQVYVNWSQVIGSYIQQQASSITMSVMNSSGLTAAIKLAIENDENGDKSLIKLVSDKIIITGDMIGNAISANSANIGGIHMYMGEIWSEATNPDGSAKFRLDGKNGTIYANNVELKGAITATSLTLKNGEQIETYVKGQIPKDLTSQSDVKEMISAYVDSEEFKQSIVGGYITQEDLEKWATTQDNLTEEQVEALIEKLAGSEVNTPLPDEPTDDGGTRHSVKIGGEIFSWVTYDADNFVVIDSELSGGTEEHPTKFMVSREGLLTAKNAFVEGKIIASEGFFKGEIEADSGYFRGTVCAETGYFIGAITANSLTLGSDATETINGMIDEKLPDGAFVELDNWVTGTTTDGKTTKVKISTNGLLQAQNAIISGSVYTTNGYFQGEIVANKGSIGGISISDSSISQKDKKFSLNSDGSGQLASSSITWDSSGNLTVDGSIFNPVHTTSDSNHLNRTVFVNATSLGVGFGLNAGSYKSSNVNSTNKIKRVGTITVINNGTSPAFFNLSNNLEVGCITTNKYTVSSQIKSYGFFILLPGATVVFDVFDKYDGSKRILRGSTPLGWFWYDGTILPCSYNNVSYEDLSGFKMKEEALGTKTTMSEYESANILTIPSGVVEYMSIQLGGVPEYISTNYNDYVVFSFYNDSGFMAAAPAASTITSEKYLTPSTQIGTDFKKGGDFRVCNSLRGSINVEPALQSLIVKLYDKNSMIGYASIDLFKYVE